MSAPGSHGRGRGPKKIEGDKKTPEGTYVLSPARESKKFGLCAMTKENGNHSKKNRCTSKSMPGGNSVTGCPLCGICLARSSCALSVGKTK